MAQNDIRRLSVGNGRVIELKEDSGALFARETSEWGFEEVFDLTTLPGYDAGRRATYRINAGNIERREAQETAWEAVMAVSALSLTPNEVVTPAFGSMTNDASTVVDILGPNQWAEIESGWVVGLLSEFTFGGSHYLVVPSNGKYLCNLATTMETGNNLTIGTAVMVNGVAQPAGHGHTTTAGAADAISGVQNVILDLTAGQQISVGVVNHSSSDDITIPHASLTIVKLAQ